MKVGLVGLGAMGRGMAASLRRRGHDVHVCDVRAEAVSEFTREGGTGCARPADLARACQVLISVVWQGLNPTVSPAVTNCGRGHYGTGDLTRRAVTASVTIGCLQNDPVSLVCVTP